METYQYLDGVKIVTLAPEIKNCSDVVENLLLKGIKVAMGQYHNLCIKCCSFISLNCISLTYRISC